jgi:hypothetical protein
VEIIAREILMLDSKNQSIEKDSEDYEDFPF